MKRSRSTLSITEEESSHNNNKRPYCPEKDLLTALTNVLSEIRSTPSRGEISAELMETFKVLLLQIEELSSDESNTEARLVKDESERCLELWLEDLLAQCEAEGEFFSDLEFSENDELALALVLESDDDEEGQEEDGQDDDDDDDDDESEEEELDDNQVGRGTANTILILDRNEKNTIIDDDEDEDEEIIIVDDDDDLLDAQHIQIMT